MNLRWAILVYPIRHASIPGPFDLFTTGCPLRNMYIHLSKALLHNSPPWPTMRCATPTTRSGDSIGPSCYVISTEHQPICAPCTLQTWCANHRYPLLALEVGRLRLETLGGCLWSRCFDVCWCVDHNTGTGVHESASSFQALADAKLSEMLTVSAQLPRSNYLTAPRLQSRS